MTETPIEPYEVGPSVTFPCNIKITIGASSTRELLVQLLDVYNLYSSNNTPAMAAHDSAEHSWVAEFSA